MPKYIIILSTLRENAIESIVFLSKRMYITDLNQYAIELVTYLLVLVSYFYEFIVYMLLERNAFDSIAFFSQCIEQKFDMKCNSECETFENLYRYARS